MNLNQTKFFLTCSAVLLTLAPDQNIDGMEKHGTKRKQWDKEKQLSIKLNSLETKESLFLGAQQIRKEETSLKEDCFRPESMGINPKAGKVTLIGTEGPWRRKVIEFFHNAKNTESSKRFDRAYIKNYSTIPYVQISAFGDKITLLTRKHIHDQRNKKVNRNISYEYFSPANNKLQNQKEENGEDEPTTFTKKDDFFTKNKNYDFLITQSDWQGTNDQAKDNLSWLFRSNYFTTRKTPYCITTPEKQRSKYFNISTEFAVTLYKDNQENHTLALEHFSFDEKEKRYITDYKKTIDAPYKISCILAIPHRPNLFIATLTDKAALIFIELTWDHENGTISYSITKKKLTMGIATDAKINNQGTLLLTAHKNKHAIYLHKIEGQRILISIRLPKQKVTYLKNLPTSAFSQDGSSFVFAYKKNKPSRTDCFIYTLLKSPHEKLRTILQAAKAKGYDVSFFFNQ